MKFKFPPLVDFFLLLTPYAPATNKASGGCYWYPGSLHHPTYNSFCVFFAFIKSQRIFFFLRWGQVQKAVRLTFSEGIPVQKKITNIRLNLVFQPSLTTNRIVLITDQRDRILGTEKTLNSLAKGIFPPFILSVATHRVLFYMASSKSIAPSLWSNTTFLDRKIFFLIASSKNTVSSIPGRKKAKKLSFFQIPISG